jgi:hypothetical protein
VKPKTALLTALIALAVVIGVEKYKAQGGPGTRRANA